MLRRILLIAKRDYIASVLTRAFLIGLVLTPLLAGGGFLGFALLRVSSQGEERRVAVIDRTGKGAGEAVMKIAREINRPNLPPGVPGATKLVEAQYSFEAVEPESDADAQRFILSDRVRRGELNMFIDIGPSAIHPGKPDNPAGKIIVYTTGVGIDDTRGWVNNSVNAAIRRMRMKDMGIEGERAEEVLQSVTVERMNVASRDATGNGQARPRNDLEGFAVPFILVMLMMMVVMGGAGPMLTIVAEDKMQRVFEMLLVSVTPFEILAGKVLASVGRSITSSLFYIAGGLLGLTGTAMLGLVPFHVLPWFVVYVIAEVTMLSALAAALGAAATTSRDAQQFSLLVILPVMLPIFLLINLIQQPNGSLTTALSFVPPLTPMIMLLRQSLPGGVPWWHPWLGLLGVIAFTLFMIWAASRVFRIAILTQGKTPKLSELARWAIRG
jgi:ABC-2 type transport system permease protein